MALALVACGGGGSETAGQTDSNGGTETQGDTTQGTAPTTSGDSQSGTSTGSNSGMSESQTDTSATGMTTDMTITGSDPSTTTMTTVSTGETGETGESTVDPSETGETGETGETTSDLSVGESSTSVGTADDTTSGEESTTEPDCIPTVEVCNDLDDDCNDKIDDVDVGMDGVCDCLSIALVGNEGANMSSEFQAYLEDQGTTTVRINSNVMNDVNVALTPAELNKYDIIILDWLQRTYTAQEAADMKAWVEAGGGLMSMTGHTNNQTVIDRPGSLIGPMGLTYNGSAGFFSGPVTNFAPHPINAGLTSLTFAGGLFINIVDDGIGVNQTIMTLPPGPVGVVQERMMGRLFVFGDEWVEFDSQWMNMPDIKQFWVQTLVYLGPKDSCAVPQ